MYTRTIVVLAVVALFATVLSGCSGEAHSQASTQFRDGTVGTLYVAQDARGATYFNVVDPDSSKLLKAPALLVDRAVITVTNRDLADGNIDLLNGKKVLAIGAFRYWWPSSFCDSLELTILGDDSSIVAAAGGMRYLPLGDGTAKIVVTQPGEDISVGVVTPETEVVIRGRNLKRGDLDLLAEKKVAVQAQVAGETGEEPQISSLVVTVLEVL